MDALLTEWGGVSILRGSPWEHFVNALIPLTRRTEEVSMKAATIALAVEFRDNKPVLLETLADSREIGILESSLELRDGDPLKKVHAFREEQSREDEEFSNYVEDLLSKPFLKTEIQTHGVRWLKSRIRIEKLQKEEALAATVIARYALQILSHERELRDFCLAGANAHVRVRVFVLSEGSSRESAA